MHQKALPVWLVLILLFLFLNARTAFWVAAGIPTAMLAALAIMYAAGITINMISLFALIITLGIVVDDAIVVGEHADSRARKGLGPIEAAETAARRMALPVFAATTTTIIAFFGLVAVGGRFGDLIADIPFTVVVVLAAFQEDLGGVRRGGLRRQCTDQNSDPDSLDFFFARGRGTASTED